MNIWHIYLKFALSVFTWERFGNLEPRQSRHRITREAEEPKQMVK
jgi:hypothetical protein